MDKLDKIFMRQKKLQRKLKNKNMIYNQKFLNIMILSSIDELMEILRNTKWKPWKKHQSLNIKNVKKEIADLLHFFINLCLYINIDAQELYELYNIKNNINIKRIKERY
jgi:dimeric dUTPase (all-alpha-NTP-PPase superfamily)